ncbi:MAG: hypothetical protein L6R19_13530 [Alphaproteobacteria bacterium]|nr:hypothetical protein [Alphaproteobacteria bacterium]
MDRRAVLQAAGSAMLAGICGITGQAANAQFFTVLCSYAGGTVGAGLAPPTQYAVEVLNGIKAAINLNIPIQIFQGGVPNAAATLMPAPGLAGLFPTIVYNNQFLNALHNAGGPFAAKSVLAHEVGHHANNDTAWVKQFQHPWAKELAADFVSGLAMAKLGATSDEATQALKAMFSIFGSPSHPDTPRRLEAVISGWKEGGGKGAPKIG